MDCHLVYFWGWVLFVLPGGVIFGAVAWGGKNIHKAGQKEHPGVLSVPVLLPWKEYPVAGVLPGAWGCYSGSFVVFFLRRACRVFFLALVGVLSAQVGWLQ